MADEGKREVEANFPQLVGGFGMEALAHLGKMPHPVTGQTALDLPNAKFIIDTLGMLQEKTRGNLSPDEEKYLASLLRDLRLQYVETAGKGAAPGSQPEPEQKG